MNFYIASATDIGVKRKTNQDSYYTAGLEIGGNHLAFAVLCDGMGGLQHGEIASSMVAAAFKEWFLTRLSLIQWPIMDNTIRDEWTGIVQSENQKIRALGKMNRCTMGSTVTVLLLSVNRYFVLNIGDSRAYEIGEQVCQITLDHTVTADEVRRGNMTLEQAERSPMKSVLTRCVGASESVYPDMFFGEVMPNAIYLLCSDGFRHHITTEEMRDYLLPKNGDELAQLDCRMRSLIEINKNRGEQDNISAVAIYTQPSQ